MDVLAGYDTSSDDEKEPRSQKRKPATPVAEQVTSEHGMREGNVEMTEIKGESKEMLPISPSASSRREESHRNRRYRQRSASPRESPAKQSPTLRGSGREERRENTRSKSRSRSHSPIIRRGSRSKSPNRFLHLDNVEVEPGVQVQLKTLLQKVDTLLENQRTVLENQGQLLSILGNHERRTSSDPSPESLLLESVTHNVQVETSCEKTDAVLTDGSLSAEAQQTVYADDNIQVVHLKPATGTGSPDDKASVSHKPNSTKHFGHRKGHKSAYMGTCPVVPTPEMLTKAVTVQDANSKNLLAWTEEVCKISSSVGNFACNLVRRLFSEEECNNRNCSGTRGKERLNLEKLAFVKFCVFKLYPVVDIGEQEKVWKQKCVTAIDELLRRGNRKSAKNTRSRLKNYKA